MGAAITVIVASQKFVPVEFCTVKLQFWLSVIGPVAKVPPAPVNVPVERFPEHA